MRKIKRFDADTDLDRREFQTLMTSAALRDVIFAEEPTIVIKQGLSTKTVKNGWQNDLIGKIDSQDDTTMECQ